MKHLKLVLDFKYLIKCQTNDKIPLFIFENFQRYSYNTIYVQNQLLQKEIIHKKNLMFDVELKIQILENKLFEYFNLNFKLDIYQNWKSVLSKFLKKKKECILNSHSKKLKRFGIIENKNDRIKVYNLNSKNIDIEINKILERGPKYVFSTKKSILSMKIK